VNNKTLYIIIGILVVIIIAGGAYFILSGKKSETSAPAGGPGGVSSQTIAVQTPAAPPSEPLSEQPNQAKYNEYLTEIHLGKLPAGAQFDPFKVIKTNVFSAGEQFCTVMNLKKTIIAGSEAAAVYDVVNKNYNQPKMTFPQQLKQGGIVGCVDLTQTTGKYEYKFYIDDVLAAVLPFEVK